MKLIIQEQHVPGTLLAEKQPHAVQWGFDGFELRGKGEGHFAGRYRELQDAASAGACFPTVCPEMDHFIGNFDPELRRDAIAQLCSMLETIAAFGGRGVMTPASWGMFSRRLPPFDPPRSPDEDRAVLVEGFSEVAAHAQELGVQVLLEPLNRYEDHMVNTLADAVAIVEEVGSPAFKVVCDTYHMNIEEADPIRALEAAFPVLGHVQLSDSNRLEPGAGHVDFASVMNLLTSNGYSGDVAFEHQLSGPAEQVLPVAADFIRGLLQ